MAIQTIRVEKLRLDGENPRHPETHGEQLIIAALLAEVGPKIVALAEDINPATAEVFVFTDFHRDYTPPPSPTIDKPTAEGLALENVGSRSNWNTRSADLWVVFDDVGHQELSWRFELDDGISQHIVVEVDATNGQARVVAQG